MHRQEPWYKLRVRVKTQSSWCVCENERRDFFFFKKYLNECALSHPQTNQQPLGNKNVLSVIVNYKYWSLPCCSLLIMPNGLPLTIRKPLTQCASVFMWLCERERPAYLGKYAIISLFLMVLKAPAPRQRTAFTLLPSVCSRVFWCLRPEWKGGEKKKSKRGRKEEIGRETKDKSCQRLKLISLVAHYWAFEARARAHVGSHARVLQLCTGGL